MKSGIVYYVARKFPSTNFKGIKDTFEYILTTKTAQPAQGLVSVEIFSTISDNDDFSTPDVVISDSFFVVMLLSISTIVFQQSFFILQPFDPLLLVAILIGIILFLILLILFIKCRSNSKKSKSKDPPHLPRPPDFITVNNNLRSLYTPSENESLPVTQSSTPLPVLSNVPHCKSK